MKSLLGALVSGTLFGAGLALSQMINPAKVLGFLDLAGDWDPSLAFVMGAAVVVTAVGYRMQGDSIAVPQSQIDGPLLLGAGLFGLGWGMAGFCPGPALAALVTGSSQVVLFVASMLAGMALHQLAAVRRKEDDPGLAATGGHD